MLVQEALPCLCRTCIVSVCSSSLLSQGLIMFLALCVSCCSCGFSGICVLFSRGITYLKMLHFSYTLEKKNIFPLWDPWPLFCDGLGFILLSLFWKTKFQVCSPSWHPWMLFSSKGCRGWSWALSVKKKELNQRFYNGN